MEDISLQVPQCLWVTHKKRLSNKTDENEMNNGLKHLGELI